MDLGGVLPQAPWKLMGRAPRRKGLGTLGPTLPYLCAAPHDDSHLLLKLNMAMDGVGVRWGDTVLSTSALPRVISRVRLGELTSSERLFCTWH